MFIKYLLFRYCTFANDMYAIFINLCTVSSNVHVELYLFPWPTLTVIMAGPNCPTNWQSTSRNVTLVQILNHLSALEFLNFDINCKYCVDEYTIFGKGAY